MTQRKICVVTGTRAEYGLFYPILKKIQESKNLQLQLIATTAHLSSEFGLTYKQIEEEFFLDDKIDNLFSLETNSSVAKSTGLATMLLADSFEKLNPDIILLLGDRFEAHAAATTALLMSIPIAHIHGGEITEGAIDEQIRHSITKMSYLHFCSTEAYCQRVIQMGEDPLRVFNTGAPGIDNIINFKILSKTKLEKQIDWKFSDKTALFTYHPETLLNNDLVSDLNEILRVLEESSLSVLFTYSNADKGGKLINKNLEIFCKKNPKRFKIFKNLGNLKYLSAMSYVNLLIGNSSSGIIESASFGKPTINIGNRQAGRMKGNNVIDSSIKDLNKSIKLALSLNFIKQCRDIKNIYGKGDASIKIVKELINQPLSAKKFFLDTKL
jgi:GDP/UDP-N,N'-diacetylbacillosamine 2-epimerase (hydrolysing)